MNGDESSGWSLTVPRSRSSTTRCPVVSGAMSRPGGSCVKAVAGLEPRVGDVAGELALDAVGAAQDQAAHRTPKEQPACPQRRAGLR